MRVHAVIQAKWLPKARNYSHLVSDLDAIRALHNGHLLLLLHNDNLLLLDRVEHAILHSLEHLLAPPDELAVQPNVGNGRLSGGILEGGLDGRPVLDHVELDYHGMDADPVEGLLGLLAEGTSRLAEEGDAGSGL